MGSLPFCFAFLWVCVFGLCRSDKIIPETNLREEVEAHVSLTRFWGLNETRADHRLGIIGGKTTNITQHPYQVAIDAGKVFVCAGALLNRIWVIALASCTCGCVASSLTVRVGSDSNLYDGTVYNVTDIVLHPNYNYSSQDYDYSLLKLSDYLCYDNTVSNIAFSTKVPAARVAGNISGWGFDYGSAQYVFRQLTMQTLMNSYCGRKYKVSGDTITTRMFCAVDGNSGPCYNDFGDPFVINGTLYGLYSWSRGCARPDFPAVFSNLATVTDWIHSTMNNALYCSCGVY